MLGAKLQIAAPLLKLNAIVACTTARQCHTFAIHSLLETFQVSVARVTHQFSLDRFAHSTLQDVKALGGGDNNRDGVDLGSWTVEKLEDAVGEHSEGCSVEACGDAAAESRRGAAREYQVSAPSGGSEVIGVLINGTALSPRKFRGEGGYRCSPSLYGRL